MTEVMVVMVMEEAEDRTMEGPEATTTLEIERMVQMARITRKMTSPEMSDETMTEALGNVPLKSHRGHLYVRMRSV